MHVARPDTPEVSDFQLRDLHQIFNLNGLIFLSVTFRPKILTFTLGQRGRECLHLK
jgi:hypothetical protein